MIRTPSVLYPVQPTDPRQVAPFAAVVARNEGSRLWAGQSARLDSHQVFAHLAGSGLAVPVGMSVALMPLRHPFEAAIQARSLAALTGHPLVAGFGAATPGFVAALDGAPYPSPRRAAVEYAHCVKQALAGGPVGHDGEHFTLRAGLPALPTPPIEVGLGVLRPRMAAAAAAVADVLITWMTPPDYIRDHLRPAIAEGSAGGVLPRIVAVVPFALAAPGRDPARVAELGAAGHLAGPHYVEMLHRAGLRFDRGDTHAGARALVEHGVFATGTADDVATELGRYADAGVDEVVLNPCGLLMHDGAAAAVRELQAVIDAVGSASAAQRRVAS